MRRGFLIAVVPIALACADPGQASEKATVRIHYMLEPTRGIPAGLDAVAVLDAGMNDEKGALATNTDWSKLAANHVQQLLQEATEQHDIILNIVDRRHTATVLKEHDLAAAGLVPSNIAGQAAQLLAVQGIIMAEINVRIEQRRETKIKIDIGSLLSGIGRHRHLGRSGRLPIRTVQELSEHVSVQTVFHLFDAQTSKNWATYAKWHRHSDERDSFFSDILGDSNDDPRDVIIEQAVQRGAREFVDMLVPSEKEFIVKVKSSREGSCKEGVRALRAEMFDEALSLFEQALGRKPNDHRAAFAAGVACEATQKFDDALRYYRMAVRHNDNDKYTESMTRVREYRERVIE